MPPAALNARNRGIAHPGGPGQGGHDRPEEGHEPAQEHRRTAPAGEELPGPVQPLPTAAQHPAGHQPGPEVAPDLVADAVADDRRCHHGHHHHRQRRVAEAGGHPAQHGGGLPGHDEPHEQGVLDEDHRRDQGVEQRPLDSQQPVQQPAHRDPTVRGGRGVTTLPPGAGPGRRSQVIDLLERRPAHHEAFRTPPSWPTGWGYYL